MNLYAEAAVCQYLLCRIIKPSIGKVLPCRCTFSDDLKPFLLKYRIPTFSCGIYVFRVLFRSPPARLKPRTTFRRNLAAAIRPCAGGRGQRQNASADHAHRMAAANRSGKRTQHYGGNVYQQSRQRNANPTRRDDSHQRPRHVARHVPRSLPPFCACTTAMPVCRLPFKSSTAATSFPHQTPA